MSPFAHLLQQARLDRNIRQVELAALVGYDQTYISALEVGLKGPPTSEFVDRLTVALSLSDSEACLFREAAAASRRKFVIDPDTPQDLYRLLNTLHSSLQALTRGQVEVMTACLRLTPSTADPAADLPRRRLRRRPRREAQM